MAEDYCLMGSITSRKGVKMQSIVNKSLALLLSINMLTGIE